MRTANITEAKAHLNELLDSVESGEDVLVTRRGRVVATISAPQAPKKPLPVARLAALRKSMPPWRKPSAQLLRLIRDEA